MANRRSLIVSACVAVGSLALGGLAGCDKLGISASSSASTFKGVDITGANYRFSLPDLNGQTRTPDDFKGKVTAVFFGYTQCPDVCPIVLAELAQVKKLLGKDGDRLQAIFITVDPERDTPAVLKSYVGNFDSAFIALRGTPEQTTATARSFKVFFVKSPGKTPGSYTVDHTAGTYLFDTKGQVRLFEGYGSGLEALNADVKALLAAG
jgi:protein SCO1/2